MNFFQKMRGKGQSPPRVSFVEVCWSWIGSFIGIAAVALMHLTRTLHPPGGATALIAVIGGESVHRLGYLYIVMPAALGAGIMLIVALIVNNIPKTRKYPEFWF